MRVEADQPVECSTPEKSGIWPVVGSVIGLTVRMVFIGLGIGAAAHMITSQAEGPRYWVAAVLCLVIYFVAAMTELVSDHVLKKERK